MHVQSTCGWIVILPGIESIVNQDRRHSVEQTALKAAKDSEKDKTAQGKGRWFMKSGA